MESISAERRNELYDAASVSVWKLELLDRYGIDVARWADPEEEERVLAEAGAQTAAKVSSGTELRRIKAISEPSSEYMRVVYAISSRLVDAGEDIRWLPRRLASPLLLPGNDMFVLDGKTVMFNLHDGEGNPAGQQWADEPALLARCREAFEAAWAVAIPHRDYKIA